MDLTVRCGSELVLYVEQKVRASTASHLIEKMQEYGKCGVDLTTPDIGNDPLRKAKYMVREGARPRYFGISAVDYRKLFKVGYAEGNRFELVEDDRPFGAVLMEHSCKSSAAPLRSPVDPLAIEMERLCPSVWASVGSGMTAYNFYLPGDPGDGVLLGVYESGEVWTDVERLGAVRAGALASTLRSLGVVLNTSKKWSFWRADGKKFILGTIAPERIAQAVQEAIA